MNNCKIKAMSFKQFKNTDSDTLKDKLYHEKVLCIETQNISDQALLDIAQTFGQAVPFIDADYLHPKHKEISISSNQEKSYSQQGGKIPHWHSDSSFLKEPLSFTLLYAKQAPDSGGGTDFVNMLDVYQALKKNSLGNIENLHAVHAGYGLLSIAQKHVGQTVQDLIDDDLVLAPPVIHPFVIKHPYTLENILYANPGYTKHILDLSIKESDALLKKLFQTIHQQKLFYSHTWNQGDVLIWDNRSLLHRSSLSPVKGQRILYRIGLHDQYPMYCQ